MIVTSLLLDIVAIGVVVICALFYARKGFIKGVINFFGTLISLVVAVFASRMLAPAVFEAFFRKGLETRMAESIVQGGFTSIRQLLDSVLSFLPGNAITLIETNLQLSLDLAAPDLAVQVVDQVLKPLVTPLIATILFFVLLSMVRVLMGIIATLAGGLGKLPGIGLANRVLGAATGVLIGGLYIYLGLCVVWAYDAITPQASLGADYFSNSVVFRLLSNLNFFAKI